MAVTKVLCLSERYQDCSKFTITDESVYTTSAPDRRQDIANILVGAKMDENQVLDYITGLDNSEPLSQISWLITSKGDGAYRFFLVGVPLFNPETTYVNQIVNGSGAITRYPNIIYHVASETYYRAIFSSFNGIEPTVTDGWQTYWEAYDLLTNIQTYLASDKFSTLIHDDGFYCNYESCLLKKIDSITDKELCGICPDNEAFNTVLRMQFMLDAANSNNWQDKATRSEVIIKEATKKYCC